MADLLEHAVSIGMGMFVAAIVVPLALVEIADATHTNVSAAVWTVFSVLFPILGVVGLAVAFLPRRG